MRTEHLYNKINELETLRSRGELSYMGGEMLSEFNEIKQALLIQRVSQQRELLITAFTEAYRTGHIELLTNAKTIADKVISGNL